MRPDLNAILTATANITTIPQELIRSRKRRDEIMMARHCFTYLSVIKYHYKRSEVARFLGKKWHCSACHSVSVIVTQMSVSITLTNLVQQIHEEVTIK